MKRWLLEWIGALALGTGAVAQEMNFPPAEGLKKFDRLVGAWEGTGKAFGPGDAEPLAWTSTSRAERVLNGHVIQENMRIEFGPGIPVLHFRSFLGWDAAADRPVSYSIGNLGYGGRQEVRWVDDNTLVTTASHIEAGTPVVERTVLTFCEKGYHLRIDEAKGAEPFHLHVEGEVRRVEKPGQEFGAAPASFFSPSGVEPDGVAKHATFQGMTGTYQLRGEVVPMPGAPKMEISGTEEIALVYGGSILTYHGRGTPKDGFAWEGLGYQWWEAERNTFVMLHLDNMGGIAVADVRRVGDRSLVSTMSFDHGGQPTVLRTVVDLDAKGHITSIRSHSTSGTADPVLSFSAQYTHQDGASPAAQLAYTAGSCCDRAQKAGKTCTHGCCTAAAKEGKVCSSCN
jgi:hypothetical protein